MASGEILVVAGEASGDLHAAEVLHALRLRRPDVRAFGMGGPRLVAAGLEALFDASEISVMGITDVLPKLPRIWRVLRSLAAAAAARRPAVALLVDVPDFNLRLARRLKRAGIPVVFYVSPTVWAWRARRVRQIARDVDRMLCILPFEEPFYRARGVPATYVGNPVVTQVPAVAPARVFRERLGLPQDGPALAILPGSRPGEVRRLLPPLAQSAARLVRAHPDLRILVPVAPGIDREAVRRAFAERGVTPLLVDGRAPEVVGAADAAIVTSGTAVLETGLMLRPMVVVYRVSALSWWIGRLLVRVAHVALVNLLARRTLVPELLQGALTPERVVRAVEPLLAPGAPRDAQLEGLATVREALGTEKPAARVADALLAFLPAALC